jgi:inward rectifier potassium channel
MNEPPIIDTDTKIGTPEFTRAQIGYTQARRGRVRPIVRGQDGSQWKDVYHFILTVPWSLFFLMMAAVYVIINATFAGLYLLSPNGILHEHRDSFLDAYFFSVQTFGSIGYGFLAPSSKYVNFMVSVESFISLMYAAIATGLLFARFSRPFARVIFSNVAVVVPFEGVPTLMFRAANQRANQILDAMATVSLARQVTTKEGITMRRFEELRLVRPRSPLFSLSWTIMHRIDETSPLYGATIDTFYDRGMEIIVLLSGMDETLAQIIYARQAYTADDILFDRRFVDVLHFGASGRMEVDLRHFNDTVDLPAAGAPAMQNVEVPQEDRRSDALP